MEWNIIAYIIKKKLHNNYYNITIYNYINIIINQK